jgi:hypothetical protein
MINVRYPENTKLWTVECILNSNYTRGSLDWSGLIYTLQS